MTDPEFDLSPLGCLAFLWPAIPEAMVARGERQWIEEAAARMPAIPRLALEVRLEPEARAADLHQFVSAADAGILDRYLRRGAAEAIPHASLREFLADWAGNSSGLRDDFDGIYLEWDRPDGAGSPAAPALFLPLEGRDGADRSDRPRSAAIGRAGKLHSGGESALRAGLDTLGEQLPAGASINYLGFMVGRGPGFRVNFRGVRPQDLPALLEAISWPGDAAVAARHFDRLVGLTDRVVVALDLAPRLQASIGFEAILDSPPAREPRWQALLDYLCDSGLCAAEKRAALETFHACFYPEQADQPWPASWLVAAALSPHAPWLERRISHLKLTIAADGREAAKAYLSAQHFWSRRPSPPPPPNRPGSRVSSPSLLARSRGKAISFLLEARGQDDLWRDFRLPNGASDEWVTAFVGCALAATGDPRAGDCLRQSLDALLRRQRPEGGWGYNGFSPPDADSTAWALKFLDATRYRGAAAEKARSFLRAHLLPGGGVATYAPATSIRFAGGPPADGDSGWRGNHLCVAANAAGQLGGALLDHLRAMQGPEGAWSAYWWANDVFGTALAVEALAGDASALPNRRRAAAWARTQLPGPRSAFDRAWLAQILAGGSDSDRGAAGEIAVALAGEQGSDGSWPAGAAMLFPDPGKLERDSSRPPVLDDRRLFTTASVLAALEGAIRAGSG